MKNGTARNIAIAIVVVTGLLVCGVALRRLTFGSKPHVELDRTVYPVRGIDLSAHNGVPDFDSIAASGIDFVYLKASEGADYRDPAFTRNYLAARRAGLNVGAYHFFRFESDGPRQAENFLGAIKGCELQLPAAIDIEEWGNPAENATEIILERLEGMQAMLKVFYGPTAIYTNKTGDARFVRGNFEDTDLWICSFTNPPLTRRPWHLWQHSHCGRIPGVKGYVDLDTFNGHRDDWKLWLDSIGNTIKERRQR